MIVILLVASCGGHKRERFNYTLIKSKLDLTEEQTAQFDKITSSYTKKARKAYESNRANREEAKKAVSAVFADQDQKVKTLLDERQFEIYQTEINIEREGREKHNMTLIRDALALDSTQVAQYNLANEAFYTLLIENHDNYHGKPDVYLQYYEEIDVSRQDAFKNLMTEAQYQQYLSLKEKYKIGKSEAY